MALDQDTGRLVLVTGLPESVHTLRWLDMMFGRGLRFVFLPVYKAPLAKFRANVRTVASPEDLLACGDDEIAVFDLDSVKGDDITRVRQAVEAPGWRPPWLSGVVLTEPAHLVAAIQRLRPAVVHSMVVQLGGYLALGAKEFLKDEFPVWLLSNWGSDIFLFRAIPEHYARIQRIVSSIDAYHAECERDIRIVRQLGFRGMLFPPVPASGGMDFGNFPSLDAFPPPSRRREIIVKGYHNWAGRGLHVLSAVHLAAAELRPYRIRIVLASDEVKHTAATMAAHDDLDIVIEPYLASHSAVLTRLTAARAVVGLGISDGISTTLLEAMAVGAFPVQGACSCGDEWVVNGETGILVDPNDIRALADALRRVASDDTLVDAAAPVNRAIAERRWNTETNAHLIETNYRKLLARSTAPSPCNA